MIFFPVRCVLFCFVFIFGGGVSVLPPIIPSFITFVSVSSVSPGTTYVTGVAPKAEGWDRRKASTIIHWVDGTWAIPTPVQATAGTVTALTTVISDTEGRGLKDWPVRYSIVGGAAAEFAPAGSQTAESKSNTDGQATVQIRQPAGQFEPGKTQVRVDVVRPPLQPPRRTGRFGATSRGPSRACLQVS